MSEFGFRALAFMFEIRDFFRPRRDIVEEVGLREGFYVLDYGCGPGGYVKPVADLVGESDRIDALDIRPFTIKTVQRIGAKNLLTNVKTIPSDCDTGLPDDSVDVVLFVRCLSRPDGSEQCVRGTASSVEGGRSARLFHKTEKWLMSRIMLVIFVNPVQVQAVLRELQIIFVRICPYKTQTFMKFLSFSVLRVYSGFDYLTSSSFC
jgi:SAM-dependent methyltransferase